MDLIFHIGTEKTGTTALQWWLHHNSDQLRKRGIWYCESLARPNNTDIYLYGLGGGRDEGFSYRGAVTEEQKAALLERVKQDLSDEAALARQSGCDSFIISNEHCHSRLVSLTAIERVYHLLHPLFEQITLYCFLRPQLDVCLSLASTLAWGGIEVSDGWFVSQMQPGNYYLNYQRVLENWASVFERNRIVPLSYKRNQDVVCYFRDKLGLPAEEFLPQRRMNQALDYRAIAVANALQLKPNLPDDRVNRNANFFLDLLPVQEKLRIDRALGRQLQARFTESNSLLIEEWREIHPNDLEIDWESYPERGNLDRLHAADEFAPILRYIVERFNALLWLEQAKRKIAESYRAEASRDIPAAIALSEEARLYADWAGQIESVCDQARQMSDISHGRMAFLKEQLEADR